MHPLSFLAKRQHLCAVARGREMFAHVQDMTPARFDILHVIHTNNLMQLVSVPNIARALGLARQTVWQAVKRLVELGLVVIDPSFNKKCSGFVVRLTKEGLRRYKQALNAAFSERAPLPKDAPAEQYPARYWRHPAVADVASIGSSGVVTGTPTPVRGATLGIDPRVLHHLRGPDGIKETCIAVPKRGREVQRIYTSFVWKRLHLIHPSTRKGRRGKRWRHLNALEYVVDFMQALANALGNKVQSLWPLPWMETHK